ncbi:hypothetical protein BRAS3843_140026 [Bradyrhizobium sp. STM 3843]|nr:hypothetical protein BRAS3843_140026 [Bradyrhizobium sp. STM 3843]
MAAPLMAPCLSVMSVTAPLNERNTSALLPTRVVLSSGPDFVLMVLADVRMEWWIIDNQDRKAPRVRHRRLP